MMFRGVVGLQSVDGVPPVKPRAASFVSRSSSPSAITTTAAATDGLPQVTQ
jgi:hypothetical protein